MEEDEEDESLAEAFSCMHARFYREHLVTAFEKCLSPSGNLSRHLQMVCNTMHQMNVPLLLAGNVLPTGTTKFSVKGSENCSILHVTFYQSKCFIKCLNGLCAAQLTNKKKFAKSISLQQLQPGNKKKKNKEDRNKLCEHIHVVYNNLQSFKEFFPHYFNENENCIPQQPQFDAMNVDDANIAAPSGNFDKETGLWDFLDMRKMVIKSNEMQHCTQGWVQWNAHITTWNVKLDDVLCILQNKPRKKLFSLVAI